MTTTVPFADALTTTAKILEQVAATAAHLPQLKPRIGEMSATEDSIMVNWIGHEIDAGSSEPWHVGVIGDHQLAGKTSTVVTFQCEDITPAGARALAAALVAAANAAELVENAAP